METASIELKHATKKTTDLLVIDNNEITLQDKIDFLYSGHWKWRHNVVQ